MVKVIDCMNQDIENIVTRNRQFLSQAVADSKERRD